MDSYLFLWKATMQYYVACERCIKRNRGWWQKDKMVGIWKANPAYFEEFSQKCFVTDCQSVVKEGIDIELFPRQLMVLSENSPYRNAHEGMETVFLPDPTPEQITNSVWHVLER